MNPGFWGIHAIGMIILGVIIGIGDIEGYSDGLSKENIGGIIIWEIWLLLYLINCIIKFIKYSALELLKAIRS